MHLCLQLWRRYLTNTRVSFVENDAKCAQKHKKEIEKVARGKLYIGGLSIPISLAMKLGCIRMGPAKTL